MNSNQKRILGNLKIYEIKPLKGPDRLLRIHVIIEGAWGMKDSIEMLAEVSKSLIFAYHGIEINFPIIALLEVLPINERHHHIKYGEQFNGVLGLEILFMRNSDSVFNIRYYTEHIEFERNLRDVDNYVSRNQINIEDYQLKFTIGEMREGVSVEPFSTKIVYAKSKN